MRIKASSRSGDGRRGEARSRYKKAYTLSLAKGVGVDLRPKTARYATFRGRSLAKGLSPSHCCIDLEIA
jgi:hypothetical protein